MPHLIVSTVLPSEPGAKPGKIQARRRNFIPVPQLFEQVLQAAQLLQFGTEI